MLDIVDLPKDKVRGPVPPGPPVQAPTRLPLRLVRHAAWQALADEAAEPNAFYLPDWARAVSASARERTHGAALLAYGEAGELTGLLPFVSAGRAFRLPLPVLVSFDPYGALQTPLLARKAPIAAAARLIDAAREMGARALLLRNVPLDGAALGAFGEALAARHLRPRIVSAHQRATLDATREAESLLRDALGPKKLKELRRQRARMADLGEVTFQVARDADEIERALIDFLLLEASGWKAARGTALMQHAGDMAFIRAAVAALARQGACEIVTLACGRIPVASGIVLRQGGRAYWFKIGVDPAFARFSPGTQLALDLTRHLCADPDIHLADSNAIPGHPMIDPIWRGRMRIGDVVLPLYRHDPAIGAFVLALKARVFARRLLQPLVQRLRKLRNS